MNYSKEDNMFFSAGGGGGRWARELVVQKNAVTKIHFVRRLEKGHFTSEVGSRTPSAKDRGSVDDPWWTPVSSASSCWNLHQESKADQDTMHGSQPDLSSNSCFIWKMSPNAGQGGGNPVTY